MRKVIFSLVVFMVVLLSVTAYAQEAPENPVKNMVTMVDLGADRCVPCKLMAPVLEKLEHEYNGKAAIVFIDVWKNPDQAKKYGISTIPTQIFYEKRVVRNDIGMLGLWKKNRSGNGWTC